ncbi:MAG: VCBS repeat-containing protein [Actinomycetota bacterium]|nr:VCBS repeat-containing protein [Actinomycetota bacterium]
MSIGRHLSGSRRGRVTGIAGAVIVASLTLGVPYPAGAFVAVVAGPGFPESTIVGHTFAASVALGNFSTPPESTRFPVLTLSQINLVPSCDNANQDCAGGVEAGVFAVSATGNGFGPPSCAGTWTITEINPGLFRLTPPNGEGTAQVGPSDFCVVDFTVTPLRLPNVDVSPPLAGVQTNQVVSTTPRAPTAGFPRATGTDQTTVLPGPTPPAQSPIAIYRPSGGYWLPSDGPAAQWGAPGDVAVPADYSGDGTDDIAVFRPSSGVWFVRNGPAVVWGTAGDIPVPADYNGDGTDDIAVFRPSRGVWLVRNGPTVQLGGSLDVPVPADYDGNGTDEMAVSSRSWGSGPGPMAASPSSASSATSRWRLTTTATVPTTWPFSGASPESGCFRAA